MTSHSVSGTAAFPRRLSRRAFLRSAAVGASGLVGAYLLGCGEEEVAQVGPAPTFTAPTGLPIRGTALPSRLQWRQRVTSGAEPPARRDHSLVSDGERLVLFGGRGPNPLGDTWVYAIASNVWEQPIADPAPPARFGHNTVWDLASNRIVLFGGQAEGGTFFNDLWSFDPETWQWSQLDTGSGPSPRYGAGAAFDPHGRLLLTHGFTTDGRFDDTWALDLAGRAWTDISPQGERPVSVKPWVMSIRPAGSYAAPAP